MRTFYRFILTFRGKLTDDAESRLAEWIYLDHDFPKHTNDYDEISDYLEWNSPFNGALMVFDRLWDEYKTTYNND